jgi:ABC-type dipeptide/oligopeptide/nickel transport system ATPase component
MTYFRKIDDDTVTKGTAYWKKYIKWRIEHNKNFLGVFIGQTGSGKSYAALSFTELLEDGTLDMGNVFMKATDFLQRLLYILDNGAKPGTVLVWDEAGKDLNSKQWQSKVNRVINLVFQVFRKERVIVLFTIPFFSFLDSDARKLVHGIFETQNIDFKNKTVQLKPKLIQTSQDTGKVYKKYLRVHDDSGLIPIKKIRLPLPNQDSLGEYEKKKTEFTREVYTEAFDALKNMETKPLTNGYLSNFEKEVIRLRCNEGLTQTKTAIILKTSQPVISEAEKNLKLKGLWTI